MVNYSGLHHHLRPGKSKESTSPSLRGTNASMASSSGSTTSISSFSDALIDDATLSNDPYFHFSTDQQDALLEDARSTATALIVDTLSGFDKWRFLTTTSKVQLFELKTDAADRVSTMRSDDPHALGAANQSHTLLAITRVRATLDDFMRIAATDKRDKFQNFLACLHDDEVQHADVFTAFGNLQSTSTLSSSGVASHNSSSADVLSSSFTSNSSFDSSRGIRSSGVDAEQYAIKYYSLKEPKASKASSARNGGGSMASKFMHRSKSKASSRSLGHSSASGSDGLTLCVGEYATIRQGKIRATSLKGSSGPEDHRIGIIASHSVDDPQVTRYCKPIASTTGSGFAVTSRSFAQFSGIVVYPVASSVTGESLLEVVVKLSCFDANGVSALKKQAMMQYLVAYRHLEHALLVLRLHDSPYLSSVNWTKSDQRKGCNVCHQSFPSFRRKHHCRLCGEVVCSKCSSMHALKVAKAGKVAFRICSACRHGASSSSSITSDHTHALAPPRKPHSDSDDDDEEEDVVEVDSQLEPIVRPDAPVQQPLGASRASHRETPSVPLLHKQQLEQHDSRHARRTGSLSAGGATDGTTTAADADAKHRAASTESSNESEFNDSRGFLSSNVTATTAASTPPSASASPLSSPTGSPLAASALSASALQQSQQQYQPQQRHEPQYEPLQSYDDEPQYEPQFDTTFHTDSADAESDERASELSVRDFHDSEFALDLSDLHLHSGPSSSRKHSGVFAIDEDFEDEDEDDAPVTRSAAATEAYSVGYSRLADDDDDNEIRAYDDTEDDDDTGFEFHDSEVGITFQLEELEEFNDAKYEALEEIQEISTASAALVQRNRLLDEVRRTRLMDYDIMDSSREASYDLIALQAAQFMGCALASVSFVDDRREFVKAAAGDVMLPGRSHGGGVHDIPKHQSLAAHIVQRCAADDLNLVLALDASHDEALGANPFVYDAPFVRFVVGVPLRTRDGVVLGALLVADTRPRRRGLSPTEMQVLQGFAEQLNELLDERWQRRMYQRRAAPAPEQIQQTLQSLLSQSYHTGQQLRQQQHALHQSLPVPRAHRHHHHHQPRYQAMAPAAHAHARESVHGRLTMQGIEL